MWKKFRKRLMPKTKGYELKSKSVGCEEDVKWETFHHGPPSSSDIEAALCGKNGDSLSHDDCPFIEDVETLKVGKENDLNGKVTGEATNKRTGNDYHVQKMQPPMFQKKKKPPEAAEPAELTDGGESSDYEEYDDGCRDYDMPPDAMECTHQVMVHADGGNGENDSDDDDSQAYDDIILLPPGYFTNKKKPTPVPSMKPKGFSLPAHFRTFKGFDESWERRLNDLSQYGMSKRSSRESDINQSPARNRFSTFLAPKEEEKPKPITPDPKPIVEGYGMPSCEPGYADLKKIEKGPILEKPPSPKPFNDNHLKYGYAELDEVALALSNLTNNNKKVDSNANPVGLGVLRVTEARKSGPLPRRLTSIDNVTYAMCDPRTGTIKMSRGQSEGKISGLSEAPVTATSHYAFIPKGGRKSHENITYNLTSADEKGARKSTESVGPNVFINANKIILKANKIIHAAPSPDADDEGNDMDSGTEMGLEYYTSEDVEDDAYLPPIPSRNYGTIEDSPKATFSGKEKALEKDLSDGALVSSDSGTEESTPLAMSSSEPSSASSTEEPIHMSWDEVMKEAKNLGIPLTKPASQDGGRASGSVMQDSITSVSSAPAMQQSITSISSERSVCSDNFRLEEPVKITGGKFSPDVSRVDKKKVPLMEKLKLQSIFHKKGSKERVDVPVTSGGRGTLSRRRDTLAADDGDDCHGETGGYYGRCIHITSPTMARLSYNSAQQNTAPSSPPANMTGPNYSLHMVTPSSPRSLTAVMSADPPPPLHVTPPLENPSSTEYPAAAAAACSDGAVSGSSASGSDQASTSSTPVSVMVVTGGAGTGATATGGGGPSGVYADFIASLKRLKDCGWYWGPLGWDEAETKLINMPDGSFLVRDSSDDRYILSLSFRSQGMTHHTRIEHFKGMFSFYSQPKSHGAATIVEFIEKAMEHSRSGKFLYFLRPRAPGLPPAPVQMLYPVSRFRNMHSLQHMCRFSILRYVRKDLIDFLPVPAKIKDYLQQSQYYTEYSGVDFPRLH